MENRIKECQTDLFAGHTSAVSMRANQLRLWFAGLAYVVMAALRRIGLGGTELARATCGTIRLKLLKIGALITVSVRRVKIAFASSSVSGDVRHRPAPAPTRRDRGRDGLSPTPPSEPCGRFSRTRLSSRRFLHRGRFAACQAG